jgi:hypothetical protein
MTPQVIRTTILGQLASARPYALPQPMLLEAVNMLVRPQLSLGELVKQLSWLKAQDMVAFIPSDLEPDNADARKWTIKEAGMAAIAK